MNKLTVTIDGKELPCKMTMGAMLMFQRMTGKEVTEITDGSLSELFTYIYCCVKSACRREKVSFDYTLDEFADMVTPEDLMSIQSVVSGENQESKKKTDETLPSSNS